MVHCSALTPHPCLRPQVVNTTGVLRRLGSFPASFAVFTLSNGSVLVSRSYNNSICMLQPGGACTTVAGAPTNITFGANGLVNGSFAGDNGPAAAARLWFPTGGVGDQRNPGRFWFCDTYNNRVRGRRGCTKAFLMAGAGKAS
jgi:hypothetical protein